LTFAAAATAAAGAAALPTCDDAVLPSGFVIVRL